MKGREACFFPLKYSVFRISRSLSFIIIRPSTQYEEINLAQYFLFSSNSFPGASETSLLDKLNKNHSGHKYYEQSLIEQAFVIKHYAGSVKYNIQVSHCLCKARKNDNLGKAKASFFYSWKGVDGGWEGVRTPVL